MGRALLETWLAIALIDWVAVLEVGYFRNSVPFFTIRTNGFMAVQ
jgi:hypothetical protein